MAPTHQLSTTELRRALRTGSTVAERAQALDELVVRQPAGLDRLLAAVAVDGRSDQAIRLRAVTTLARHATTTSLRGLRAALDTDDAAVEQRAIERLGKIGQPDDVELLRRLRSGNPTTRRVTRTAKLFLSYRHRLGAYRADSSKRRLAASSVDAIAIRTSPPTAAMRRRIELLAPPVPGIDLRPEPARRLVCGRNELAVMINAALAGGGTATLTERQSIPAVLVRYNNETGAYDPVYYLLSDPVRGDRIRLTGMRGSGRIGLEGSATVDDDQISFEVHATDLPLEHPLTVDGSYRIASGVVDFATALTEPRFDRRQQRALRRPRPVDAPLRPA